MVTAPCHFPLTGPGELAITGHRKLRTTAKTTNAFMILCCNIVCSSGAVKLPSERITESSSLLRAKADGETQLNITLLLGSRQGIRTNISGPSLHILGESGLLNFLLLL